MTEHSSTDKRIDDVKSRLHDDLVDEGGAPADPATVDDAVDAATDALADAPVQEFVPLLVEHDARDTLRQSGLHRELGDDDTAAALSDHERDGESIHLSAHQGFAMPEE